MLILDPIAFYYNVADVYRKANSLPEFYNLLIERRKYRL